MLIPYKVLENENIYIPSNNQVKIKQLIADGANLSYMSELTGNNALHECCFQDFQGTALLLLERFPEALNDENDKKMTPLDIALQVRVETSN